MWHSYLLITFTVSRERSAEKICDRYHTEGTDCQSAWYGGKRDSDMRNFFRDSAESGIYPDRSWSQHDADSGCNGTMRDGV